jgi:hypothetical protein
MARIRVSVLGPARLEISGVAVHLTPLTTRLLVRLVAAEGEAVPVRLLRREVWGITTELPHQAQRNRNEVQKRILELRRALDTASSGDGARILRTEQLLTSSGPETAYRLVLRPDELDCAEFTELVNSALHAAPATAAHNLADALRMLRGRPLAEASGEDFAGPLTRRLIGLQDAARGELIRSQIALGRYELALPVAERMAQERPDDPAAAQTLGALRDRLRERHGDELLRHRVPGGHADIVVVRGDLFDQHDANLVVGFTDTFDTSTDQDFVISRDSVQGQLVDRVFDGRRRLLDEKLRLGLKAFTAAGTESTQDKPRGRRTRYPIGTTVAIPIGGRRVFATAYSRLGNDLVARSGPADLRLSMESLWLSAALYGLFKPLAVPLIGSGLARVVELDRAQLITLIIETFARSCRADPTVAPELRIVIRPEELAKTDLSAVEKSLRELDRPDLTARHESGTGGR